MKYKPLGTTIRRALQGKNLQDCIIAHKRTENESGERIYSKPTDAEAMEEESIDCPSGTFPLLFDLYEDATTVSSSGAQSITVLRMRFVNEAGAKEWRTIGIPPEIDLGGHTDLSDDAIRMAKLELSHRFLHLVLRDIHDASKEGIAIAGCVVVPRLHSIVVDQPEERSMLCLYQSSQCELICSLCEYAHRGAGSTLNAATGIEIGRFERGQSCRRNARGTTRLPLAVAIHDRMCKSGQSSPVTKSQANRLKNRLQKLSSLQFLRPLPVLQV